MSQTRQLVKTLKKELRRHGINYRQVAQKLDLSEASVKRLFADGSFTLDRISQVCELMELEISDLVHLMEKNLELTHQLTLEQETELVSDIKLLLMAYFLMNRRGFDEIIQTYDISETEGIRLLARLDRMKFLDLLPGNRVRMKIAKDFSHIPGGPIERFFEKTVQQEFFASSFNGKGECRVHVSGFFSRAANAEMIRRIKLLGKDAHEAIEASENLPIDERYGCSVVLAIRPWEVKAFDELRREPNDKKF